MKNLCGKVRKVTEPYEIWKGGDWTWKVLKKYKNDDSEASDPYARWFCAVETPMTAPDYDLGDVYVSEIKSVATCVYRDSNIVK